MVAKTTKTIHLTEGAYARLAAIKREGESFSDVVNRLTGRFALLGLVGALDEGSAKEMRGSRRELGRRMRKRLGQQRRSAERPRRARGPPDRTTPK